MSYVCFTYGIPLPYIAADEAFGSIRFVNRLLRRGGAFFVSRGGDKQQQQQQLQQLLAAVRRQLLSLFVNCIARRYGVLEVFLEGGRSKTGMSSCVSFCLPSVSFLSPFVSFLISFSSVC